MSICILAIPVALALRAVMGEKKFNEWVESNTMRFATNFKNEKDLVRTVKNAGYDAEEWGTSYKTHIDKDLWFLWEFHENKWQANFSKSDDVTKIKAFFSTLQRKANRQILYVAPSAAKVEPKIERTLPTIYADEAMLKDTLRKYGASSLRTERDGTVRCTIDGIEMNFHQAAKNTLYELSVTVRRDEREIYAAIRRLDEGYQSAVQERTYLNVKKKLADQRLTIEHEEILEDNSIVLTVSV